MGKSKAVDTATSTAPASEKSTATDPRTADKDDGATPTPGLATLLRVLAFSSRRNRAIQILSAAAAVAAGAAMPLMALILGRLTANITSFGSASASSTSPASASHFMDNISTNALWFVYLFIGKFFLVYIWGFGFTYAANRTVQALRLRCLHRILHKTVPFHDAQTPGSLANTITARCNAIQTALADRSGVLIQAFSTLLSAFAVAFSQSWQLTLVMLGIVILTMALIGFIVGSDQKLEARLNQKYDECSLVAEDALGSIKTVVAFGAGDRFLAKYKVILGQAKNLGRKKGPFVGMMFAAQYFFMYAGWAIGFWFGAWLYTSGRMPDPGRILSVFFSTLIGMGGMMALGPNMPLFIKAIAAADDVFRLLHDSDDQNEQSSGSEQPNSGTSNGSLRLQDMSFCYPSRLDQPALSNVNISFAYGTSTAIVGPSGAGKSTLISLLERWVVPTSGSILLDGYDISTFSAKWLRSQIALVQQEPQLFNTTIFDNIAHGLSGTKWSEVSRDEKWKLVEKACYEANATEFIEKLPNGLESNVGDQGSLLSGGQKQRIAIARALVGQRPILLMDEATSALDNHNSKAIESLITSSSERITIFISHKIRSAMQADHIVVLDKGKVAEQGTHDNLMRANGVYKRLYDAQTVLEPRRGTAESTQLKLTEHKELGLEETVSKQLLPVGSAESEPYKRSFLSNLVSIAKENKRFWPIFLVGFCACVVTAQPFPVQGILLGQVLETFQGPTERVQSRANFWGSMFLVVGIAALLSYAMMGFFMTLLGVHILDFYRLEYFRAVLLQPMHFFDQTSTGALVSRLSSDPSNLQELIGVNMGLLISMFIQIISAAIIGLAFSWKFALVGIFGAQPFVFAAGALRFKLDTTLTEATALIFENSASFASDSLSAIRTVKAFTLEMTIQDFYQNHLSSTITTLYRKTAIVMLLFALSESVELLALALAFWYGGKLLSQGQMSTAAFFTVFIAVVFGGQAAGAIFGFTSNVSKARLAASNILSMRERVPPKPDYDPNDDTTEPKDTSVAIDFRNVAFAYPARPDIPVLKGITFQVSHGQTVGIVGSSGSGKSTLLALVERFYDVQSGSLSVLGAPVSQYPADQYRKRLAYVSQEPRLYRGSIYDNIVFGVDESNVNSDDVTRVCDAANLTDLIASLPEGYNSECGTGGGVSLSGGQKQRVAIARALIRNPEILLFDEPTSALDAESEKMVQDTLQNIEGGRTIILVTHRLNTIQHADVIFVMSAGQIVERGNHGELMAERGIYYNMFQQSHSE